MNKLEMSLEVLGPILKRSNPVLMKTLKATVKIASILPEEEQEDALLKLIFDFKKEREKLDLLINGLINIVEQ